MVHGGVGTKKYKDSACQTVAYQQKLFADDLREDDELLHFYTGLENFAKFSFVLQTLGPAQDHLIYYDNVKPKVSVKDQFLLVLMKLRRNYTHFELGRWFGIDTRVVCSIFITWINYMYAQWGEIDWFPKRDEVTFFSGNDFRDKFPKVRMTLDATEIPIQKPHQPLLQQATYSSYKNKNTLKVMVGTSPGGLVTYVSPAYGGSTSDRQIMERSDILKRCDPKDMILADKGINCEDLMVPYDITSNIPTFFRKKNRLSSETVLKDRKCSSKRAHVERHIGNAKTYKIISSTSSMNHMQSSLGDRIITVCFYLCNFRRNIMS